MKRVEGEMVETVRPFFEAAAAAAGRATCRRARCGTVIVKDGEVIGEGWNSPPLEDETQRTCDATWDYGKKPKYDLTCCIHAEWRAVLDACKRNADKIGGATLYFMRIDEAGRFTDAGEPYCTVCSRLTLESGVGEFVLWNNGGADAYETDEYNRISYEYHR